MAAVFFNHMAGGKAAATSAGTSPATKVNPAVAEVMLEEGIDIHSEKPKLLTIEMMENADRVITMGCGGEEVCPASLIPTEDWTLEDPAGKPIEKVREIRDEIRGRVEELVKEYP
jgi:protein-tyrosine-phosphatase